MDQREGRHCPDCGSSLRSAGLAMAILRRFNWPGTFEDWTRHSPDLRILEINRAGSLTEHLSRVPGHYLIEYPHIDIEDLGIRSGWFDMVVHSDTIEHVKDPVKGLEECRRVLTDDGALVFTVPVVPGRLTRRRDTLTPSFHGTEARPEYLVVTEYGADFWVQLLDAGFGGIRIESDFWPATFSLIAER